MSELNVAILATDDEQRTILQMTVDGTTIARTALAINGLPLGTTDPILRRIHDARPDVILVDIQHQNAAQALRAIELLQGEYSRGAIFAIGDVAQPQTIITAMRAGAREYLERPTTTNALLEAFVRLTSAQRKSHADGQRGRVFTVLNAKGGSGATTVAVNTALALQSAQSSVALIDLAPLGHTALHLNVKPSFTVLDAMRNLHRLDGSLLESFMVTHPGGLHVLAGSASPFMPEAAASDFARLFDLLVNQYRFVIVDASSRLDASVRMVCDLSDLVLLIAHTDVASLWSAARVNQVLSDMGNSERVRLILNRFRKIPGFSESDVEAATGVRVFFKVPNQYLAVSSAIDRGIPVTTQNHTEIAKSFLTLASALTESEDNRRRSWSLFRPA